MQLLKIMPEEASYQQGNITSLDFKHLVLKNNKDENINCRYYQTEKSESGFIMVGGVGGGFDTPAKQLYPKLATALAEENISGLRIQFRHPTNLHESVQDVLTGIKFLESEDIKKIGLVGHSMGGAVVIQAGVAAKSVKTVVTLATQAYGAENVSSLSAGTSILLIHGANDPILPFESSTYVYSLAHQPKKLEILEGNGHTLDQSAEQVFQIVHAWLIAELK
jgi:pimeloyl-ACP methyl ester carboxylesterase